MSRRRKILELLKSQYLREAVLSEVSAWNRDRIYQVISAVIATWLLGATALHFAERRANPLFYSGGLTSRLELVTLSKPNQDKFAKFNLSQIGGIPCLASFL